MRALGWVSAVVTLIAAGAYTILSLARWEWNRAVFFLGVFVAAEVALAAALVLRKLAVLELWSRSDPPAAAAASTDATRALQGTRAEFDRFPWLRIDPREQVTRANVFITLLVGGGLVLSGAAWLLDRVASRTADPVREARLGRDLAAIDYPDGGLVVDDVTAVARTRPQHDDASLDTFLRRFP